MRKLTVLLCLLAASAAMAQSLPVETVTVDGELAGIWRVSRPDFIAIDHASSPPRLGPMRESFCRIAQEADRLAMHCAGLEPATVTTDGEQVHIAWGMPAARMLMVGEMESADHFRGRFRFELSGATYDNPALSEASRVKAEGIAGGGRTELLRRVLSGGLASVPHDPAKRWPKLPQLGAVGAITYLGQQSYLVGFADGERICDMRQRADGVLEGVDCV